MSYLTLIICLQLQKNKIKKTKGIIKNEKQ